MTTPNIDQQMQTLKQDGENMRAGRAGWDRSEYGDGGFESGTFASNLSGERWESWHGLGKFYENRPHLKVAEVVADVPALASPIIKVEAPVVLLPDGETITLVDHALIYREMDMLPLGVPGFNFPVVQPIEHFSFMDALTDASEAQIISAMTLNRGRTVAMTYELPGGVKIAGWEDETIRKFLSLTDSYDGGGSLKVAATPIRTECTNSNRLTMTGSPRVWSVRHTKNMRVKVDEARRTLRLAYTYYAAFEEAANKLVDAKMPQRDFTRFLNRLVPLTDKMREDSGGRAAKNREHAVEAIQQAFATSPNLENVRNTKWAAYQAVTEWNQWARPVRETKRNGVVVTSAAEQRYWRAMLGTEKIEDRAAKLLLV